MKNRQNTVHWTSNIHQSAYQNYRVCLYVAYHISMIDLEDLDPKVVVHFRRLVHTGVNRPIRVVFSLLSVDMWHLLYGIGRSLAQTSYRLLLAKNPACIVISILYLKYIKT